MIGSPDQKIKIRVSEEWAKAQSIPEIKKAAGEVSGHATTFCPAASILRFVEERWNRRIIVIFDENLRPDTPDGSLMVPSDFERPIFIFVPAKANGILLRFCLFHEIAHIILGDVSVYSQTESFDEVEDEWIRACWFAFALLMRHGEPQKRREVENAELLGLMKQIEHRVKNHDWPTDLEQLLEDIDQK